MILYFCILNSDRAANLAVHPMTFNELDPVIDALIADLLLRAAIAEPPVDPLRIARALGLVVAYDEGQSSRGRHVRLDGLGTILVRSDNRPERLHWALAHE